MSLERPHSRASSGSRGPPPTPPPTYLWEEVRRSKSRGGYPWTILYKPPLPDYLDIELLLKGEISNERFAGDKIRGRSAYGTDKRTRIRNRLQERERTRRARSEPTPSLPSSSTISLSAAMDQAMAVDPSVQSDELEDFPLPDEDIPDFVMAYLQSDKGNLDEDIPDHILEYIQSRAAILEKNQLQQAKQTDDDIFYTKEELRIIDEARKRLEEQGELDIDPSATIDEDMNAFDHFFQRTTAGQESAAAFQENASQIQRKETRPEPAPTSKKSSKGGKFNFSNITIPNKAQLNIKLPKFGPGRKKVKDANNTELDQQEPEEGVVSPGKQTKPRRPHSSSPMRQKINQQFESWNNSLKKFKASRSGRNNGDGQIKSFVALLPGRSSKATKSKEPENQYEEVGPPRSDPASPKATECNPPDNSCLKATVDSAEEKARLSPSHENNEAEETMDDIENLPESEEAEVIRGDGIVVDREVADVIVTRGEFVDIDIDENFEDDNEAMDGPTEIEQVDGEDKTAVAEPTGFAARSRKAYELTKSKIQTSLSKEQLQATRNKLQSTLSKQNLQATRKKVQSTLSKRNLQATRDKLQSTLSKENFQATRNKLQTSLNSTLNRKKNKTQEPAPQSVPQDSIFPTFTQGDEREYETSTPVERKTKDSIIQHNNQPMPEEEEFDSEPPTVKQRAKHRETTIQPVENSPVQLTHGNECENIEEETEEDLEDELEPKLEFSIHGSDRPQPSSVSQSTETLPEDEAESDKENVVVRPKRQRYRNRRHGFHEEFGRPQSAHVESNIRSSWVEKTNAYPTISQEMLSAFCAPVNSLEAVDNSWGSGRKPDRPVRSRSKKELNSASDDHFYSNVPPRHNKRGHKKGSIEPSNEDNHVKTWPRKALATEKPVVPKRCKSKMAKKPLFPVCSNYQTWPRRSMVHSPPTAPKRARSRRKVNEQDVSDVRDIEGQIENAASNILIDADTLFGAESRFIDEDGTDLDRTQSPHNEQMAIIESGTLNYNLPGESPSETKILNSNKIPKPLAPNRRKNNKSDSLRKAKHSAAVNYSDATWPRMSRTMPSVPQRRKPSVKKTEKTETVVHLDLEKPSKKLPTVPASTPSEDHETNEHGDGESASSVQADLDQILEILASTFPQEATPQELKDNEKTGEIAAEPVVNSNVVTNVDDIIDENPYAEIKQFQKRTPPPRPPPPIYAPASTSSYSYIYTVPRRKKGISNSVSPERPPRTYCTIRPHRPPRKHRPRTPNEIVFESTDQPESSLARRHSFSGGDEANKEERDLQSAPIVERMRARPLPAPPRTKRQRSRSPPHKPPRSRTSSLKRHNPTQLEDTCIPNEEVAAPENATNQLQASNIDEYEPIENPAQIEEISVGIQTDPLPEYDESVIIAEPNEIQLDETPEINNNLIYEQQQQVNAPARDERLPQEQVEPPPLLEPAIMNEQEDNSCPQIIWSAANSPDPDPDPIRDPTPVPEPVLLREPVPESIVAPSHQQQQVRATQVTKETPNKSSTTTSSRNGEDEEADSFSQIPAHFHRSIAPLPPIHIDFPTRLQLSDLDVERLNVREVMAERLIVSSVDTNSLQVCQMTTSNASGQLMFNIGPGVTIPLLTNHRETNEVDTERRSLQTQTSEPFPSDVQVIPDVTVNRQDGTNPSTSTPPDKLETSVPQEIVSQREEEPITFMETPLMDTPSRGNVRAPVAHSSEETGDRTIGPTEGSSNPSVSDLAMQLANLSARNIMSGVCVAATETYSMAQRVAELGLQQFSDHLQRRGIQFDDKEKEDLKAVLLMLLIVVCAIFLLGMGKQRISNHWDFYFPN